MTLLTPGIGDGDDLGKTPQVTNMARGITIKNRASPLSAIDYLDDHRSWSIRLDMDSWRTRFHAHARAMNFQPRLASRQKRSMRVTSLSRSFNHPWNCSPYQGCHMMLKLWYQIPCNARRWWLHRKKLWSLVRLSFAISGLRTSQGAFFLLVVFTTINTIVRY